jgi:hypothetical protein
MDKIKCWGTLSPFRVLSEFSPLHRDYSPVFSNVPRPLKSITCEFSPTFPSFPNRGKYGFAGKVEFSPFWGPRVPAGRARGGPGISTARGLWLAASGPANYLLMSKNICQQILVKFYSNSI